MPPSPENRLANASASSLVPSAAASSPLGLSEGPLSSFEAPEPCPSSSPAGALSEAEVAEPSLAEETAETFSWAAPGEVPDGGTASASWPAAVIFLVLLDPPPILLEGDCGKGLRNAFAVRARGVCGSLMRRARSVSACRACGGCVAAWLRVCRVCAEDPSRRLAFNGLSFISLCGLCGL